MPSARQVAALLVLPAALVAAALLLRHASGPYWIWHVVDASYFYLFDSLNLAILTWPGHPYHPGTTVQAMGALVLRLLHPSLPAADLTALVLDDPEGTLHLLGNVTIGLEALALLTAGLAAFTATGRLFLALVVQTAPFLSMVILKNSYHVKPEPMLIAVMLAFTAGMLLALRPGALEGRQGDRTAIALGIVAGFGVATKLTAGPVFLAPLFLLGSWRLAIVYGLAATAATGLFLLPAAGSLHLFGDYLATIAKGSGPYGSGQAGLVDPEAYPKAVLKLLKRPTAYLPLVIALLVLATAGVRRAKGLPFPRPEARALAGILLAGLLQVLAVAKQPTANYMIPEYMLLPLAIVLAWRFAAGLELGTEAFRQKAGRFAMAAVTLAILPQAAGLAGQAKELKTMREAALGRDDTEFERCAQVYFFPASAPSFALNLGNWWTGSRFPAAVAARVPKNRFWYEQNSRDFRDASGPRDIREVAAAYPCLMLRGGHKGPILGYLAEKLPDLRLDSACSTPDEFVFTAGIACKP